MTMVPLGGLLSSMAGTAGTASVGSDTERTQKDALAEGRTAEAELHAEQAAGIGTTDKDQESGERDADGRRLWEKPPNPKDPRQQPHEQESAPAEIEQRQSKDPTGISGSRLDLMG